MRPVFNPKPTILPGMRIKLRNGKNVTLFGRESYDWDGPEVVDSIEGNIIRFQTCSAVNWFTTDMDWEIL